MAGDYPKIGLYRVLAGAQCTFHVPSLPSCPEPILAIEDELLSQRAREAWVSAWSLKAVWYLWAQFLWCGQSQAIPDATTQRKIASEFPDLAAMGPILEALAPPNTTRGKERRERDLADHRAGITRGPTRRMTREERRLYRGRKLEELIAAFQKLVRTNIRSLGYLGASLPRIQRPVDNVLSDACLPMMVTLDTTGRVTPIDFQKEAERLTEREFMRVISEVFILGEVLESRPIVLFLDEGVGANRGHSAVHTEIEDDEQLENAVKGTSNSHSTRPCYLGIHLDVETGELRREGYEGAEYLTPTHVRILRLLIRQEGGVAKLDNLRSAWVDSTASDRNIHTEIRRLRLTIGVYGLKIANKRGEGYTLVHKSN